MDGSAVRSRLQIDADAHRSHRPALRPLPIGQRDNPASFRCAQANGNPMMVIANPSTMIRWPRANHQPANRSHSRLPTSPSGPVPIVGLPVNSSLSTAVCPNGRSVYRAIFAAARAHGMPTIVTAMMTAARWSSCKTPRFACRRGRLPSARSRRPYFSLSTSLIAASARSGSVK